MMDYETIKVLAKQSRQRVTDLIALSPANDPFYSGTPKDRENGEWFAVLWRRFGYISGVHLRRVHYQIVSQNPPVAMPNGLPYENTEKCWAWLGEAAKQARYLGLVDPADFDDRRNPGPVLHLTPKGEPAYIGVISGLDDDDDGSQLPDFPDPPDYWIGRYEGQQRYHVEVWCEKSTMNDILIPMCERYGANLQTGLGELSITKILEGVRRFEASGRPGRILYISDFDPAGQTMPFSAARKFEFFVRSLGEASVELRLIHIALSAEQVRAYQLPRVPIKDDEKRKAGFEERFGEGAVELDALEALHPGTLRDLVRSEIGRYYDARLSTRVYLARLALHRDLQARHAAILAEHAEEIAALEAEYEQIRADVEERMASHSERRRDLWQAISAELEAAQPDIADYPIPEAEAGDEHTDALYDSGRDYLEQLAAYKAFQGKGGDDEAA